MNFPVFEITFIKSILWDLPKFAPKNLSYDRRKGVAK